MATIPTHMLLGGAIGLWFGAPVQWRRVVVLGACCAAVPDVDGIGYRLGVPYESVWGHRGITHSVAFAVVIGAVGALLLSRRWLAGLAPWKIWLLISLTTASHGVSDAMTSGGLGVAFFAPVDAGRYFLPWRPIRVSPMSLGGLLSARGVAVIVSEVVWVWGVTAVVGAVAMRRVRGRR